MRNKIEPVERTTAVGYAANGESEHSRKVANGRSGPPMPKTPQSYTEAVQQSLSRIGRLQAQLKTECNFQLRSRIMHEIQERKGLIARVAALRA